MHHASRRLPIERNINHVALAEVGGDEVPNRWIDPERVSGAGIDLLREGLIQRAKRVHVLEAGQPVGRRTGNKGPILGVSDV